MPVDPTFAVNGPEWQIALEDSAPSAGAGAAPAGESFGSMLAGQIEQLSALQQDASVASRSLADGNSVDADTESAKMAENGLQYQSLVAIAKGRLDIITAAIGNS